jgi:hypothetical protein
MIRRSPRSRWQGKVMPARAMPVRVMSARAVSMPATTTRPDGVTIPLAGVTQLGIQHQIHVGSNRVLGKLLIIRVVAQKQIVMMMVTRPWRMLVTRGMRTKYMKDQWDLG